MKTTPYEITEWPEKTLFTRQEAALWRYSFTHKTKGLLLGLKRIL